TQTKLYPHKSALHSRKENAHKKEPHLASTMPKPHSPTFYQTSQNNPSNNFYPTNQNQIIPLSSQCPNSSPKEQVPETSTHIHNQFHSSSLYNPVNMSFSST
ncbi:hypothetical protein KC19_5G109200, partial [Ceratodon purpureus]